MRWTLHSARQTGIVIGTAGRNADERLPRGLCFEVSISWERFEDHTYLNSASANEFRPSYTKASEGLIFLQMKFSLEDYGNLTTIEKL